MWTRLTLRLAFAVAVVTSVQGNVMAAAPAKTAPYGAWTSPISAESLTTAAIRLDQIHLDGDDLYWIEGRPEEDGRQVIVRRAADGTISDVTPPGFNVRTRVHEYGGGAYTVADGIVYFANFDDQRLYRQVPGDVPKALTPEGLRYADCVVSDRLRALICVREDHTREGVVENTIVAIDMAKGGAGTTLFSGTDFVSSPRLSADGRRLAWIAWDHPNMPWDTTTLWVADLGDGPVLANRQKVAGGKEESVIQPQWAADGTLYFLSDRSNWWNLYAWRDGKTRQIIDVPRDIGEPAWVFGQSSYALITDDEAVVRLLVDGFARLARADLETGALTPLDLPFVSLHQIRSGGSSVYFLGASASQPEGLYRLDGTAATLVRRSRENDLPEEAISRAQPIDFPTGDGADAHAFYYPPTNPDYRGPEGTLPPLIVTLHGGPTGMASPALNREIQYWTSRGFALVDVNYRGSSGFGRKYRNLLRRNWGVADTRDAVEAARYLASTGKVDGQKLLIRGGSAGGYTVLSALAFYDVFAAGADYYGISDITALVADTHKFESRYIDNLIGPYPEAAEIYKQRSPINHLDGFSAPLIVFQGLADPVVPPNQSQMIVEALRKKGVPVAFLTFEGEGHGFRMKQNIVRSREAELYFYSRVLGFPLADNVPPVKIDNLD